jgi:hypothetical protein
VILVEAHTKGGPIQLSGADPDNEIMIFTGSGDEFMMDADPEGFKLEAEDLPYWAYEYAYKGCGGAMMVPVGRLTLVRTFDKSELIRAMCATMAVAVLLLGGQESAKRVNCIVCLRLRSTTGMAVSYCLFPDTHLAKRSAIEPYMRTEGKIGANRSWGVASPRSS